MSFTFSALISAGGLFLGMLLCFEVGRRIGVARLARDPDGLAKGSGPVEAAVFGLLGLLLAFTFSGAGSRLEDRRHLIAGETNAIGTAYLRVDLLPPDAQPEITAALSPLSGYASGGLSECGRHDRHRSETL